MVSYELAGSAARSVSSAESAGALSAGDYWISLYLHPQHVPTNRPIAASKKLGNDNETKPEVVQFLFRRDLVRCVSAASLQFFLNGRHDDVLIVVVLRVVEAGTRYGLEPAQILDFSQTGRSLNLPLGELIRIETLTRSIRKRGGASCDEHW